MESSSPLPVLIQGGMGAGVSGWPLARAVSLAGQLGVISGVALDALMARRLQRGDPDGRIRHALSHFPAPAVAERILDRYFVPGGVEPGRPYRPVSRVSMRPTPGTNELAVAANFVEVFLAKEGHDGVVGINYLEKMQLTTPAATYGAMLAGVDYVLMGAGIPNEIPRLLDCFAAGTRGEITITVEGAEGGDRHVLALDPERVLGPDRPLLRRPRLLAIVSSHVLAAYLARDPVTRPDGFVVEAPVAGGHSARPRGTLTLDDNGDPVYGARDDLDFAKAKNIKLPFWVAGGYATPERLAEAQAAGAVGIQVGSAFALCRESGMDPEVRQNVLRQALDGTLAVRNDPRASPTNFPFKVAVLPGTLADPDVYAGRPRLCDLGYLRSVIRKEDGSLGYRCPAEPVEIFVRKGGSADDAEGRRCLCNGLLSAIGLEQHRADGYVEPPVITLGQDLDFLPHLVKRTGTDYGAADVIEYLLDAAGPDGSG